MKSAFALAIGCALALVAGSARAGAPAPVNAPPVSAVAPVDPAEPNLPKPPLLGFCAAPVRPACIDLAASYANARARAGCNAEMEHYVKYVFAWRLCLNAEMERAVHQTNEDIQRHKCRMAGGKNCP